MKKLVTLVSVIGIAACMSGCMSPGGLVIGPVSSYTSKQNERALIRRAAVASTEFTAEQKKKIFQASAAATDAGEVAVMVGVDILQLRGASLTKAEIGKQILGVLGDAVIYGAAAYAANEAGVLNFGGGDDSSGSVSVNVGGNNNNVSVSGDTTTTSTTTQTDNSNNSQQDNSL